MCARGEAQAAHGAGVASRLGAAEQRHGEVEEQALERRVGALERRVLAHHELDLLAARERAREQRVRAPQGRRGRRARGRGRPREHGEALQGVAQREQRLARVLALLRARLGTEVVHALRHGQGVVEPVHERRQAQPERARAQGLARREVASRVVVHVSLENVLPASILPGTA